MNISTKQAANGSPLLRLQASITPRDDRLLGWLYDHGVLTSDQIAKALFPSLDFTQRRLLRLTNLKAVARFRPNRLDGGSYPYHYVLDQLGYEHVMGQRGQGLPKRDQAKRRYQSLISRPDLPHLLGTNSVFTALAEHERIHPGTKLAVWLPASHFHQPTALHRFGSNPHMITKPLGVPRPDGAGVWVQDRRAVPFFVEYDTGSERLDILTEKIGKYSRLAAYAETWTWPVLFVLPSAAREQHLHDRISGVPGAAVATASLEYLALTGKSPADDVWHLIGHSLARQRLTGLPYTDTEHDQRWNPASTTGKP